MHASHSCIYIHTYAHLQPCRSGVYVQKKGIIGHTAVDFVTFTDINIHICMHHIHIYIHTYIRTLAALSVGRVCAEKGIIGYIAVDFVTFTDTENHQRLWAVDLNIGVSDTAISVCMYVSMYTCVCMCVCMYVCIRKIINGCGLWTLI
jgi:hypothetical protein